MLLKARLTPDIFKEKTHLTSDASSGDATLTVKNISDFTTSQTLIIGELGSENAEVVSTHTTTSPSGTTITLSANLTRDHSAFTKVTVILYDQVKFLHASTKTGTKTTLATKDINGDQDVIYYDDTSNTSGYYFVRYSNSVSSDVSEFSDPIPFTGLAEGTVGSAINYALNRVGKDSFTDILTYDFFIEESNNCLQYVTNILKRWSKLQEFDYVLGQTSRGNFEFILPDNIWEDNSYKSILNIRIGSDGTPLSLKTKEEWDDILDGVNHTQVRTAASSGDTTLAVDNSYDFDDSGTITVYINNTQYDITYTGVTRDDSDGGTATFTGIPASGIGAITTTIPVDTNVWQGEDEGEPLYAVVYDGKAKIWELPSANYDNLNVYIDYYTQPTSVDSDADVLDVYRYTMIKYWLTWAARSQLKNPRGERETNDQDYQAFREELRNYVRNEVPAHNKKRRRNWSGIDYGGTRHGIGR